MPLYPGTGALSSVAEHDNIVNAPLHPGDGGAQFKEALESRILPRLAGLRPELIIMSAGFDAHQRDPLANPAVRRGRLRLGHPQDHGESPTRPPRAAWCRCSKAGYDLR